MASRLGLRVALLLIMPWAGGCILTDSMWRAANETILHEPVPVGIIESAAANTAAEGTPAAPQRMLVVAYSIVGTSEEMFVTIPLTPAGRASEPFAYVGDRWDAVAIVKLLPPEQRYRIQ